MCMYVFVCMCIFLCVFIWANICAPELTCDKCGHKKTTSNVVIRAVDISFLRNSLSLFWVPICRPAFLARELNAPSSFSFLGLTLEEYSWLLFCSQVLGMKLRSSYLSLSTLPLR